MFKLDELKIYKGDDIYITDKIKISQPTIGEIANFGEQNYFNSIYTLVSVGADLKWQLWDYRQIDYTKIDDYDLFIDFIYELVGSKKRVYEKMIEEYKKNGIKIQDFSNEELERIYFNPLQLILNVDLGDFIPCKSTKNEQIILYNEKEDITIDRMIYSEIVDVVRKIHGLKRNNELPANERTKMDLIDDARDEAIASSKKPYKSILKPLISALTVKCGLCGKDDIWNMKVNMFFDNIKRANKIQDSQLLLQGAYSGFSSLKGVDTERLNWTGDL